MIIIAYYNYCYSKLITERDTMTDRSDYFNYTNDSHPIVITNDNELQELKNSVGFDRLIRLVTDGLTSDLSRVMYGHALNDFMDWYMASGYRMVTKAVVNEYKVHLQGLGYAPSTINQRLSAIRKLAKEASDNGLMELQLAQGIRNVTGVRASGVRTGNWLTQEQAQLLLNCHDLNTLKGLRDRAILAVMLGGGLRRSEVSNLTFDLIQQREGRWVIVDMVGKGNRVRSVPIPSWSKQAIDEWSNASGIKQGKVFRSINRGGNISGDSMTNQAIQDIVKATANKCGLAISAHDLRRTFAKLSRKGGGDIKQIQLSLGHASVVTTERYLGETQDLTTAPCDVLGLKLNR